MTWVLTATGIILVLCVLRDIFHTLWHPSGFGRLSRSVFRLVWRLSKVNQRRSNATELAGPLALLGTLGTWASLSIGGFVLIYLPRMPDDFFVSSSLEPQASSDILASLYLSLVAVGTLGLGDIVPATPLMRIAVPMEALVGFVLLTAGISWVLQLYPALVRRRALARRLTTMCRSGVQEVVATGNSSVAVQYLEGVRSELAMVEMDLVLYAESYYFRECQVDTSLAAVLPFVADLVAGGERSSSPEVRQAAMMLRSALGEVLALLRRDHLGEVGGDLDTLVAFAEDHHQPILH